MLDIAAALTEKRNTADRCRLGRWLAEIPTDTPAREQLVAILTENDPNHPDWRSLEQIDAILRRLGISTSNKTVGNHRAQRCRCYQ